MPDVVELPAGQAESAWAAMRELRPHLASAEAFARQVDELLRPQGYRLVASLDDGDGDAAAVAGFRIGESLAWGRHLYVDDLVTRETARRRGHAAALMAWLFAEAERQGCRQLHLDSGVGPDRWDAHALYFAHGLRIASHHFAAQVPPRG